jgi:drug/metabolite transporter (DMT)-like permease
VDLVARYELLLAWCGWRWWIPIDCGGQHQHCSCTTSAMTAVAAVSAAVRSDDRTNDGIDGDDDVSGELSVVAAAETTSLLSVDHRDRSNSQVGTELDGTTAGGSDGSPNTQNIPKGIALQLLATMLFALSHVRCSSLAFRRELLPSDLLLHRCTAAQASIKQLGRVHPNLSVLVPLWMRYCIFVWFAVPVSTRCSRAKLRSTWRTNAPRLQLMRSFLNVGEVGLIYAAVPHLPLADANAVMALMNIIVVLLAALPPLREPLGWQRALCVLGGFSGSLLIFKPGSGTFSSWSLVVLLSSTLAAVMIVMTRVNARYDSSDTILLWTALLALLWTSLAMPFIGWSSISPVGLALIATAGFGSTAGDYLWIAAVSIAPASVLMPFQYSMFVWACVWGFTAFDEEPGSLTILGAVIIAGAGILSWHFERRHKHGADVASIDNDSMMTAPSCSITAR